MRSSLFLWPRHGRGTCSCLSPKSDLKSVYSLLRSVAGPFSSSSSLKFFNYSPRESASFYAKYLRSYFSLSQAKALHSRAWGCLSVLWQAKCPEEFHSFWSPFCWIFCGCPKLLLVCCHWPKQSCLSHAKAPSSLCHRFFSHFQSFLVFTFLSFHLEDVYCSHLWIGKASRLYAFFQPIPLTSCVWKLFERIIFIASTLLSDV